MSCFFKTLTIKGIKGFALPSTLSKNNKPFPAIASRCGAISKHDEGSLLPVNRTTLSLPYFSGTSCFHQYHKQILVVQNRMTDAVKWTQIIENHCANQEFMEALNAFGQMRRNGSIPYDLTYTKALFASGKLVEYTFGQLIHMVVLKSRSTGRESLQVTNGILQMYWWCGAIQDAESYYKEQNIEESKEVTSWVVMIRGYAQSHFNQQALQMFDLMKSKGIPLNSFVFSAALYSCMGHDLLETALRIFRSMIVDYGIQPQEGHLVTMATILGRHGRLTQVAGLIIKTNGPPNMWCSLLTNCEIHGNLHLAILVFDQLKEMNCVTSGVVSQMAKIYAQHQLWKRACQIREDYDEIMNYRGESSAGR